MLSTICSAKQKSLQIVQDCVTVRDGSRMESGNEFHSDGPQMEKLLYHAANSHSALDILPASVCDCHVLQLATPIRLESVPFRPWAHGGQNMDKRFFFTNKIDSVVAASHTHSTQSSSLFIGPGPAVSCGSPCGWQIKLLTQPARGFAPLDGR